MADIDWDFAVSTLATYDADGFLGVQHDAFGGQQSGVIPHEVHCPHGIYGRPLDTTLDGNGQPNPASANQILHAMEGGKGHVIPLENPSIIALLPTLKPGEAVFYGPKGQFLRAKADGSFAMWCPANASGDPDFSASLGPDGVAFAGRWGKFEMNDNRISLQHVSGARIDLGGVGGLPAPLSAVSSAVTVSGGSFDARTTAVSLGPDSGSVPMPIPNGTFLLAQLLSINVALKAIAAALASAIPASGITAAQTAVVTAACGAVLPPIPTLLYSNANATVG